MIVAADVVDRTVEPITTACRSRRSPPGSGTRISSGCRSSTSARGSSGRSRCATCSRAGGSSGRRGARGPGGRYRGPSADGLARPPARNAGMLGNLLAHLPGGVRKLICIISRGRGRGTVPFARRTDAAKAHTLARPRCRPRALTATGAFASSRERRSPGAPAEKRRKEILLRGAPAAVLGGDLPVQRLPHGPGDRTRRQLALPRGHPGDLRPRLRAPLVPRLPRRARTATCCSSRAATPCRSPSRTGCAASATATSTATGGRACTASASASGTARRPTSCA